MQSYLLHNGFRILHIEAEAPASHCGLFIDTGSRDELEDENGLAHFIEHVIFKGTRKRKSWHILNRLESVGGELNAYTTKEETCIYASFLSEHYERAVELISDLVQHSVFPEKELEKEKEVIIDEINSYRDTPSEEIHDRFEEMLFEGSPLGRNILGTEESIRYFNKEKIIGFMRRNYHPEKMVLCSAGKIDFGRLKDIAEKYFSTLAAGSGSVARTAAGEPKRFKSGMDKPVHQTHCILGTTAYNRRDPRRYAMTLLNNILGGPAMNSRLNLSVRERHGYCYHIESFYQAYLDTGVFGIYLGTDNDYLEKSLSLIRKEIKVLREKTLGIQQLRQAKKQIRGQITLAYESNQNRMLALGRNYLHDGMVLTLPEFLMKFEEITGDDILEISREALDPDQFSMLTYSGKEN